MGLRSPWSTEPRWDPGCTMPSTPTLDVTVSFIFPDWWVFWKVLPSGGAGAPNPHLLAVKVLWRAGV